MSAPPDDEPRPFPLRNLLEMTGLTRTALRKVVFASGSDMAVAHQLGCTLDQADRWALRAGFHPAMVWVAEWNAIDDIEGAA